MEMTVETYKTLIESKTSEHELQSRCVTWFRQSYRHLTDHLFAIPNGATLGGDRIERGKRGNRLKREGMLPGVADLFLAVPSGELCGLWIEMKTVRGQQTAVQKQFEMNMTRAGYGYAIARNRKEFARIVGTYLDTGRYG